MYNDHHKNSLDVDGKENSLLNEYNYVVSRLYLLLPIMLNLASLSKLKRTGSSRRLTGTGIVDLRPMLIPESNLRTILRAEIMVVENMTSYLVK